jgi:hypothetical protein
MGVDYTKKAIKTSLDRRTMFNRNKRAASNGKFAIDNAVRARENMFIAQRLLAIEQEEHPHKRSSVTGPLWSIGATFTPFPTHTLISLSPPFLLPSISARKSIVYVSYVS